MTMMMTPQMKRVLTTPGGHSMAFTEWTIQQKGPHTRETFDVQLHHQKAPQLEGPSATRLTCGVE